MKFCSSERYRRTRRPRHLESYCCGARRATLRQRQPTRPPLPAHPAADATTGSPVASHIAAPPPYTDRPTDRPFVYRAAAVACDYRPPNIRRFLALHPSPPPSHDEQVRNCPRRVIIVSTAIVPAKYFFRVTFRYLIRLYLNILYDQK